MEDKPDARSEAEALAVKQRWTQIAITSMSLILTIVILLNQFGVL